MPNPQFLKAAKRWMNPTVPEARPVKPIPQNPLMSKTDDINFSYLEGSEGERIFKEYQTVANKDYQGVSVFNNLSFKDNLVKGSDPFSFILLNKILMKEGIWVASPSDLERCLRENDLDLKGTYGDSGLVLRSEGDPNSYLASNLALQVKQKLNLQYPLMIPLNGLDLGYDSNSPNNLAFKLTDKSEIIYAPELDNQNSDAKFNETNENGLPILDTNGTRTLYTGEGGLRRLYRNGNLNLGARDRGLAYSDGSGRVVVCREATHTKK